ncbi:MAG: cellulase family glycosylhydrolase [Suilimivivens sp.]
MRGRRIVTVCAIMLAGVLVLQGCGRETAAGIPEEKATDDAVHSSSSTEQGENLTEESNTELYEKQDSSKVELTTPAKTEPATSAKTEPATPEAAGALHVEGTRLLDSNGNPVQLRGLSSHGLSWFPDYINEECFRQFREEWNVNVIRLALYTAESGGYCTDGNRESLKKLIRNGVEYATNQDMYVIIDWHILSDNNPNTYLEESRNFFDEMSEEYKDYNNVIYEICNEPNGGTSWSDIKSYAVQVIETIRANDDDGIILVGTPNWSQGVDQAAADPITGYDNIMYTLHFYAATHTDWLRDSMKSAIADGLPVFVSEYGICDASGNGAIDEYQAEQWIKVLDEYGISYVAWNISNKNETSAILNSSCKKVYGFSESDLSASGKWLYHMLTGKEDVKPIGNEEKQDSDTALNDLAAELNSESLSVKVQIKNSWESEGKSFYQYELTIENTSDSNCDRWEIDLPFNDDFALSDGWNGEYSVNGSTLHITCKDYNGSIATGESAKDIGFIVSGMKDLKVVE